MLQRRNRLQGGTEDAELQDMLGKYKSEELKRHLEQYKGLGDLAGSQAALARAEPFGAATRGREAFTKAGFGNLWNDEWDKMPVDTLADKWQKMGSDIHSSSASYQKALDAIAEKAASAERIAADRNATELEKQRMKSVTAGEIAKLKSEVGNDPKKLEEAAVALFTAARVEPDAEKRQQLIAAAQEFMQQKAYLNAASAGVGQSGAPDLAAMGRPEQKGIPTRGPVPIPAPPPVGMGASAPAAAAAPPPAVPSAAHINALKNNPAMAAEFDAKFGPGAAAKYSK
jgi:hypothetical protein